MPRCSPSSARAPAHSCTQMVCAHLHGTRHRLPGVHGRLTCPDAWLPHKDAGDGQASVLALTGSGRPSCLLPPCQGGPKPWGQAGKMTLLAESDRGWLPTQRKRKFYGRKLDLKSNQAPGKRAGQRLQPSGWAVGQEARNQVGKIVPSACLPREPGLLLHCWGKDQDPRARQATRTERCIFANMSPRV